VVSCNRACNVTAWAQMPKARHAAKGFTTRRRSASLTLPSKEARIRLKLSPTTKRQLRMALRKTARVALRVRLSVIAADWGDPQLYTKKVVVKRQARR
jgi:hypothetical protein